VVAVTTETKARKPYIVTYPVSIKVWAYDEADALREANQTVNIGWPNAHAVASKAAEIAPQRAS
jgi:hypothetical protein